MDDSPVFAGELSAGAEIDGRIVGCWLTSVQELKIAENLRVKASTGLIVVHPEYRRRGIGTSLWEWRRRKFAEIHRSLVGYGVSSKETHRKFWSRLASSPVLPDRASVYSRLVSKRPIEETIKRFQPADDEKEKRQGYLVIRMSLAGLPDFTLDVGEEQISLSERDDYDIEISGELSSSSPPSIILALLRRQLRISGIRYGWKLLLHRRKLMRFMNTLREVI